MFNEQEKKIIIMALIYFKGQYSVQDVKDLGFDINDNGVGKCGAMVYELIEDFIGPTWDEEATAAQIEAEVNKRTGRLQRIARD
jgi:hypothetical protein